jgi:hypothetical protein
MAARSRSPAGATADRRLHGCDEEAFRHRVEVVDYREHSVGLGNDAAAVAYLETRLNDGRTVFGVGMNPNIVTASLKAVVSAANRAQARQGPRNGRRGGVSLAPLIERNGGCVCGSIRFKATGEPLRVTICHCTWCQRRTGTAFGTEVVFESGR